MTIGINAHRWDFLRPERSEQYIEAYNGAREEGWKELVPSTTRRQFATAHEILCRLNSGQEGLLLADDVGLGKTTVAVLCALVFAGSAKRVRILAPNAMMGRRWRQELEIHLKALSRFARHLELDCAGRRLGENIRRLNEGAIAVSTHQKVEELACDLLIVDEVHRTRSKDSKLSTAIRRRRNSIGRVLVLTATPFSIDPNDLARLLRRIGGDAATKPMKNCADLLADLWQGQCAGAPEELADQLVDLTRCAVDAMRPFVIRHGIADLHTAEQPAFGKVNDANGDSALVAPADLLEAMLRADRALNLGQQCKAWGKNRRNDPRYHVARGQLVADLEDLQKAVDKPGNDETRTFSKHHADEALKKLRAVKTHPKIADTVESARRIVSQGEKVLIFCDHHLPATELTLALAKALRWPSADSARPGRGVWREAWTPIVSSFASGELADDDSAYPDHRLLDTYVDWLVSDGVRLQVESWIGDALQPGMSSADLTVLLRETKARGHPMCDLIADHATKLYGQLTDRESRSTLALLQAGRAEGLPGTSKIRVAAVCEPGSNSSPPLGVFYSNQPDATLAVFNSPFGPDVLVATDRLSEGVDLHGFCRHLIHHELDPSPVRTVQRNGRLRRVNCWSARSGEPIRIMYPSLRGTRDEKLVSIMRYRTSQFDLLLGGVREEVDPDESVPAPTTAEEVLNLARRRLDRVRLGIEY